MDIEAQKQQQRATERTRAADGELAQRQRRESRPMDSGSNSSNPPPLPSSSLRRGRQLRFRFLVLTRAHRLLIMLAMTFFYFVIELVFGYISHSMALIADSFHMMSDVIALSIAYGCLKIAERSKSSKNTFGWVRAEVLGALVNGVFLLALCFTILIESVQRLLEPEPIKNPAQVLLVGTIGFVINLIGMAMFHGHIGHSHSHGGVEDIHSGQDKEATMEGIESRHLLASHQDRAMQMAEMEAMEESLMMHSPSKPSKDSKSKEDHLNMRAVFLHVLSDAVGSVIVIVTALVSWQVTGYDWLKLYMDPSLSIIMVCLMVCTTFPLVRETALILLQTTPKFINVAKVQKELLNIDGVVAVHEFHVWRLVGERIIATVHIRFRTLRHYLLAAEPIRSLFHDNHIHSTTIQPEFAEMNTSENPSELECAFACLPNNCKMLETAVVTCCDKEKRSDKEKRTPPKKSLTSSQQQPSQSQPQPQHSNLPVAVDIEDEEDGIRTTNYEVGSGGEQSGAKRPSLDTN